MRIEILARNYEANDKLKEVITKKVSKLNKYFDAGTEVKVYLKKESRLYKTEISISYRGSLIRAAVLGENFYDNIDQALPKIEKQIYKHRTRIEKKLKDNAFKEQNIFEFNKDELKHSKVVKTKHFNLQPMDIFDAISELDLIGHTFYVYLDKSENAVRVIYRRDDGDIGLIVPEYN